MNVFITVQNKFFKYANVFDLWPGHMESGVISTFDKQLFWNPGSVQSPISSLIFAFSQVPGMQQWYYNMVEAKITRFNCFSNKGKNQKFVFYISFYMVWSSYCKKIVNIVIYCNQSNRTHWPCTLGLLKIFWVDKSESSPNSQKD